MAGTIGYVLLSVVAVLLAVSYPSLDALYRNGNLLKPLPSPLGLERCKLHTELSACEDIAVHNGWAFLACGDPVRRLQWWPPMDVRTNTDTTSRIVDTVYAYEFKTDRIIKLGLDKFPSDQDFVLHGFGLYVSSADANDITLFFINHRRPGSVIDIFSHTLGTSTITYTQTYKHAMLKSPNGIAPLSADSFLVTNDLCNPTGPKRLLELVFRRAGGSIQYHSTTEKAKIVAHDVVYPNGIAFSPATSQAWVCSSTTPELLIYNYDADMNRLKLRERVALLSMCDNVHISPTSGHVYTAGIVNPLAYLKMVKYSKDLGARGGVASRAVRVVNNTGEDVFYGRKYKVETLLVSDGEFMGGGWAVAAPEESRGKVLVGGQYVQGIAVCDLP